MRRRFSIFVVLCLAFILLATVWHISVRASRVIKDLSSSANGENAGNAGTCDDTGPTPFAVALNGTVQALPGGTCADFPTGTYPNYALSLQPPDKSFTLTVTPILWEFGTEGGRQTILHLEFSSTIPTLKLQSFVIANSGLTLSPSQALVPEYVACAPVNGSVYILSAVKDNVSTSPPTTNVIAACTLPTMSQSGALSGNAIQPTPIQFADSTTTRWDIVGLAGSTTLPSTLPSVNLAVQGFPNTLATIDGQTVSTSVTNNLTQAFMANQANFLAVAVNTSTGISVSAGSLSIPAVTKLPGNDSIATPTVVNPFQAIASGFNDQVNTSTATPQESASGAFTSAPSNPADPILPSTCFDGGTAAQSLFRTVWYSFTPVGNGTVTIDTASSRYDTVVAMFTGTPGNLTMVPSGCGDDFTDATGNTHFQARLQNIPVTQVASGTPTTYFILVGEAPPPVACLDDSTGQPTAGCPSVAVPAVAAPLANDATLFLSVLETPTTPPSILLAPVTNTTLAFGSQQINTTSAAQSVTITSQGDGPLTISNITFPSGFTENDTCSAAIPKGSSCKINVSFQPTLTGTVSGNLTFTDDVTGSTPNYPITAIGTNPVPTAASVTPSTALVGQAIPTLTVTGTNFVTGASVIFNGATFPGTVSNSGTTITASILATALAATGNVPVVVFNPLPGGGNSNTLTFAINNPVPAITSINPTSGVIGQAIATLTVTGSNFVTGAKVTFNGISNTGIVSNGGATITAAIPATELTAIGSIPVTVTNPTPGGGASNSVNFAINNPPPVITSINPTTGLVGQAIPTLTVTGTNFVSGATVSFNGTSNAATVSNAGATITAAIPATELPAAGPVPVIVTNPAPGGGASNSATFTISNPVPVLTSISPATAPIGTAISPLTVTGTGFLTGSTLIFNGTSHAGTVTNNGTTLTAIIAATELASAKSVGVTVSNPTPGGGTSNSISFVIDDFSVTGPTTPVTVTAGQTANFALNFGTQGGALGTAVSFSATGLPTASAASFSNVSIQSGNPTGTTTLMITTTARTSTTPFFKNLPKAAPLTVVWLALFALTVLLAGRASRAEHNRLRARGLAASVAVACLLIVGCGSAGTVPSGGGGTPAGTYTITVTASAGAATRTTSVTLTVQ